MWEVVKTVKGYDITRMVGSRGAYHVSVREGKGFRLWKINIARKQHWQQ